MKQRVWELLNRFSVESQTRLGSTLCLTVSTLVVSRIAILGCV